MTSPELTMAEKTRLEKRAKRFWVSLVVMFLGIQIGIGVTAIYVANSDPTVAIIPNYYDSAVNWDTTRRARQKLEELGWTLETRVGEVSDSHRAVTVLVHDAAGAAIEDLRISADSFHHARGSEIDYFLLKEVAPGEYRGSTGLTQEGVWQLKLQLEGLHGMAESVSELQVH